MKREADSDVALAIELASMCQMFNCLPKAGGLLDQDPLHVIMVREVMAARQEKEEAERGRARGV